MHQNAQLIAQILRVWISTWLKDYAQCAQYKYHNMVKLIQTQQTPRALTSSTHIPLLLLNQLNNKLLLLEKDTLISTSEINNNFFVTMFYNNKLITNNNIRSHYR